MNLFVLAEDAKEAAKLQCDQHVVKMPTEYAQLLSTAHRVIDGVEYVGKTKTGRNVKRWDLSSYGENKEQHVYKASHVNHPSNVWVRESRDHYAWTFDLWYWTAKEYEKRYGRKHATEEVVRLAGLRCPPFNLYDRGWKDQPLCMPDEFKTDSVVESYQNFYRGAKVRFARYKNGAPDFMKDVL